MPITINEGKTPAGHLCMVARVSGHVTLAEAQAMGAQLKPGQPYHQARVVCLVDKSTEYSPDSRRFFETMRGDYKRMASVVHSPVLRASINFMLRVMGQVNDFRMFSSEAEAMTWLDAI